MNYAYLLMCYILLTISGYSFLMGIFKSFNKNLALAIICWVGGGIMFLLTLMSI